MAATQIVDNFVAPANNQPSLGSDTLGVVNSLLGWATKGVEIYQTATAKQADKIIANATADQSKVNPESKPAAAATDNKRTLFLYGSVAAILVLLLVLVVKK